MTKKLNLNINALVLGLTNLISCGRNSVYKCLDIAYRLIQSALHNHSLEAMYKLTKYLSADRMLAKLHNISVEEIKDFMVNCTRNLKLPKSVTLAIDFTEKEYYGDKNHPGIMGSKGGKYVQRFIEMSVVKPALFISALINKLSTEPQRKVIN